MAEHGDNLALLALLGALDDFDYIAAHNIPPVSLLHLVPLEFPVVPFHELFRHFTPPRAHHKAGIHDEKCSVALRVC